MSWVALGKLLNIFVPQFPHLSKQGENSALSEGSEANLS